MKGFYTQDDIENGVPNIVGEKYSPKMTQSILERYPEYSFKPTTINDKRGVCQKLILSFAIPILLYLLLLCIAAVVCVFVDNISVGFMLCVIPGVVILILLGRLIKWYIRTPKKSQIADYIQTTSGKTICVKDGKFGVLNNFNNKLIIPTIYDKLTWEQNDKLLRAEQYGESFLIDIHNNRLK